MKWSLRSYNLLVNERGHALKLIRGTWRHPEQVVVLTEGKASDLEKQQLLRQGMNHVFSNIIELERALLSKLESKKRAVGCSFSPAATVLH